MLFYTQFTPSKSQEQPGFTFVNVAHEAGIHFKHFYGKRSNQLPEDMGSGAAWFDYNQDSWQDLFIANTSGPLSMSRKERQNSPAHSVLYKNNGDGTFTDVTKQAGLITRGYGMGVDAGDYNNDGWPDLFVSQYGHNLLFQNNGNGAFKDVTREAGLYNFEGFWSDGQWGDYDRDGYLDLYVTGYVKYKNISSVGKGEQRRRINMMIPLQLSPGPFESQENLLFHNNGDGTFTEHAANTNTRDIGGKSLAATWCDVNNDGWPDLIIANDVSANTMYLNNQGQSFVKEAFFSDQTETRGSMGLAVGDIDQDQDMDIYITNWMFELNELLLNQTGNKSLYHFQERALGYGVGESTEDLVGWGTGLFDFDNDTYLDLFITNGSTNTRKKDSLKLVAMPNKFYWNRGPGKGFVDATASTGEALSREIVGRGAAFADYDNDGDIDTYLINHGGQGLLLQNQAGNNKNWVSFSLEGSQSNRSAIGARLFLKIDGNTYMREVDAQPSYLSQNSLVQHFGLDQYTNIDSLVVEWPSRNQQVFTDLPINTTVHIKEGQSGFTVQ